MLFKSILAGVGAAVALSSAAHAATAVVAFPAEGASWSTAQRGSGTLGPGGQTGFMFVVGDNITATVSGTGLASVDSISDTFKFVNHLGAAGATVGVDLFINGVDVGGTTVDATPQCFACAESATVDANFAPIAAIGGEYTLAYRLVTAPSNGSIAFIDGGSGTLSGVAVPEPATWAMMLLGLGLIGAEMRRRPRLAAAA